MSEKTEKQIAKDKAKQFLMQKDSIRDLVKQIKLFPEEDAIELLSEALVEMGEIYYQRGFEARAESIMSWAKTLFKEGEE